MQLQVFTERAHRCNYKQRPQFDCQLIYCATPFKVVLSHFHRDWGPWFKSLPKHSDQYDGVFEEDSPGGFCKETIHSLRLKMNSKLLAKAKLKPQLILSKSSKVGELVKTWQSASGRQQQKHISDNSKGIADITSEKFHKQSGIHCRVKNKDKWWVIIYKQI